MTLFAVMNINAQDNNESNDDVILFLQSGSQIEGKVLEWIPGDKIVFLASWGSEITFEAEAVKKIVQKSSIGAINKSLYNFRETGVYYSLKGNFITGNSGSRANAVNGIGFSASAGHRFNRFFSLGGGIGWDQYIWNSGEELIPLFAEVSGFFNQTNTSLMYNLQLGYSLALKDEDYLISHAKGGWMVYPSIGVRFGKNPNTKYFFDIGYKFQNAEYTYDDQWTFGTRSEQTLKYQRLTLRFGLLL